MAGLLDLFSGRSSDIYGEGLLTPEQRGGIGNRGLLALAAQLGKSAGPSFSPVPDFGSALGMAAGAYGAGTEEAGKDALNAILTGLKGTDLQSQLAIRKQVLGLLPSLLAGDGAAAGAPATSGSTGGGAAAPLGAGGGGGPGRMSYDQVLQLVLAKGFPADKAPIMAATIMAESGGNPSAANLNPSDPGGSYGLTQINAGAHGPKAKEALGNPDRAVELAYDISKGGTDFSPWSAYKTGAYRRFLPPGGGAPTAAAAVAPAPVVGGGLLAPTAPNPLSDAEPMLPIVRTAAAPGGGLLTDPNRITVPPPASGTVAPDNPQPGDMVNGLVFKGGDAKDPRSWAVAPRGAITPSGGGAALEEPPGFAGRQLVAQLAARPPLDDLSQYRQVAGPGAADAAAAPRAPLPTMGPAGIELPPMQGPLAAPPAAAAPAAPAAAPRGLLAPPAAALPAVPAAPNINARALAAAGVLSQLGGLPDIFKPLENFYYQSPGYKGQVTTAEEAARSQFVGPNAAATAAAQDPFIRGQAREKSEMDVRNDLLKQGVVMETNPTTGERRLRQATDTELLALTAKDRNTPTTELKDYQAYVADQGMRNLPALSYFDWSLANKKAGAASTVLNTQEGFEAAQTKARIAIDQKMAETIGEQALTGSRFLPLLDEVLRIANETPEGFAGTIAPTIAKAASSLGLPVSDRMSNAELLRSLNQRLIPIVREPGATSQGEMATYLEAGPGLERTAAGRIKIAEMTKAMIQRTNEIAKVYRNNLGAPDLHEKLRALDKPLFTDEQRAAMNVVIGGTRTAPTTGATPAAPPGSIATPYGTITPVQ